jgi:hypothetical protein
MIGLKYVGTGMKNWITKYKSLNEYDGVNDGNTNIRKKTKSVSHKYTLNSSNPNVISNEYIHEMMPIKIENFKRYSYVDDLHMDHNFLDDSYLSTENAKQISRPRSARRGAIQVNIGEGVYNPFISANLEKRKQLKTAEENTKKTVNSYFPNINSSASVNKKLATYTNLDKKIIDKFYQPFINKRSYNTQLNENIAQIKKDTRKSSMMNYYLQNKKANIEALSKYLIIYNNPSNFFIKDYIFRN